MKGACVAPMRLIAHARLPVLRSPNVSRTRSRCRTESQRQYGENHSDTGRFGFASDPKSGLRSKDAGKDQAQYRISRPNKASNICPGD